VTMGKELTSAAGLQEKAVPDAQCKRIDRDFSAKCDYLVGLGVLAEPRARVLKKLHQLPDHDRRHRVLRAAACPGSWLAKCGRWESEGPARRAR
jgi:hypothetical protein